ncbi:MAG: hypothetical protein IPQ09_23020 [Myxococcales bacterium]|nr:hypothetical protein [Myxococcales bacterium]
MLLRSGGGRGEQGALAAWSPCRRANRDVPLADLKDRARDIAYAAMPGAKITSPTRPSLEGAATEAPITVQVRGAT